MVLYAAVARWIPVNCCAAVQGTAPSEYNSIFLPHKNAVGMDALKNAKVSKHQVVIQLMLVWVVHLRQVTAPLEVGLIKVQKQSVGEKKEKQKVHAA